MPGRIEQVNWVVSLNMQDQFTTIIIQFPGSIKSNLIITNSAYFEVAIGIK